MIELAMPEDAHARAEWEAAAAAVLRKMHSLDADAPDSLAWDQLARTTLDGITVPPLGLPGVPVATVRPPRHGAWDIRTLVSNPETTFANSDALADLEGGATSVWVVADPTTDLAGVLQEVLLDLAPVVLDAPTATVHTARAYLHLLEAQGYTPAAGSNLGADPLGAMLRGLPVAPDEGMTELTKLVEFTRGTGLRSIVVDATAAHDLGASEAQELGWSVAVAVAYLRALTTPLGGRAGLTVEEAAEQIEFRYAATDEQFPTIAKLRAARTMWRRVLDICGHGLGGQRQHVVTSRPMLSKYGPYVNMLRVTVAAFAAGVGGADAVTVLPFDSPLGVPEGFGRRIARNVSHLLIDESHVAAVVDPAGGAYAVEQLTGDLARAGWEEFKRIEREWERGEGFDAFVDRVGDVVAEREEALRTGERHITGLTRFPNADETLPHREPDPLNDRVRRYGAAFEEARDAQDAQTKVARP